MSNAPHLVPSPASRARWRVLLPWLIPIAVAAIPAAAHAEDTEGERVLRLLDTAAESARDRRVIDGVTALATGSTAIGVGVALWTTSSDSSTRTVRDVFGGVFVGVGSVLTFAGGVSLLAPSTIERLRATHGPALRAGGAEAETAAREVHLALGARATAARIERHVSAFTSFALGATMAAWGIALEVEAADNGRVLLGRSLLVASAGSVAIGVGDLLVRSEEERFFDLLRRNRSLQRDPASCGLRVTPRIGLGTIGLAGTF